MFSSLSFQSNKTNGYNVNINHDSLVYHLKVVFLKIKNFDQILDVNGIRRVTE